MSIKTSVLLIFALIAGIPSCKKEKMQEKKLRGDWIVNQYLANNDSLSMDLLNIEEATSAVRYQFRSDSFLLDYELFYAGSAPFTFPFRGTWKISEDKLKLKYDGEFSLSGYLTGENSSEEEWDIVKLTKNKFSLAGKNASINSNIDAGKIE